MKRLRVDVEAVQHKHRVDVRRTRARHALERLELDNEPHRARRALAAEAAAAGTSSKRTKEDAAALKAAVGAAAAAQEAMEVHMDRVRALVSRQARESAAVIYRVGSELRLRTQTAQPLTKTEKRERRRARDAARAAALVAGQAVQQEEDGESEGESEGEEGAAKPSKRRAAAPAAPKPRVMAPLPPNVVHFGVPPEYVVLLACARCGSHVPRSSVQVCIDCARELCCRGGVSTSGAPGHPCAAVYNCKCGFSLCHDCYVGAEARGSSGWRACTSCGTWMCSRETASKLTVCKRCGVDPVCRSCRYQHEKLCSQTHEGGEGYREGDEEEEEEIVPVDPRSVLPSHDDDDDEEEEAFDDEDDDEEEEEEVDDDDDSYA